MADVRLDEAFLDLVDLDADRHVRSAPHLRIAGSRPPEDEVETAEPSATAVACVAAVRRYVARMVEAGAYPGLYGYQRAAWDEGWPSATTVAARLGSWPKALHAAGFDTRRPAEPFVSEQDCVAAVAAYAVEAAERGAHPGLVAYERAAPHRGWPSRTTVTARLGSWTTALQKAGVCAPPNRRADRGDCLRALTSYVAERTAAALYPGIRDYQAVAPGRGWPTGRTVAAQLGPWPDALRQAGFSGPTRSGRQNVTREECVAAIQAYVAEATAAGRHPGVVGYDAVSQERGWPQRQSTVMARLGSWSAALSAAGYHHPLHQRGHRVSRSECVLAVRSYLDEMSGAGETPSLAGYGNLAKSRGWPAVATVLARIGSWQGAVRAAGGGGRGRARPDGRRRPAGDHRGTGRVLSGSPA